MVTANNVNMSESERHSIYRKSQQTWTLPLPCVQSHAKCSVPTTQRALGETTGKDRDWHLAIWGDSRIFFNHVWLNSRSKHCDCLSQTFLTATGSRNSHEGLVFPIIVVQQGCQGVTYWQHAARKGLHFNPWAPAQLPLPPLLQLQKQMGSPGSLWLCPPTQGWAV